MRYLLIITSLCFFLFSSCEKEEITPDTDAAITLGSESINFTSAFLQYGNTAPPSSSRVTLHLLGENASINSVGEVINLPSDMLRLNLQVPNSNGELISGIYPVSRVLPTESNFVSSGLLIPAHDGSFANALEVQSGMVEITVLEDRIIISLTLTVSGDFGEADFRQVKGQTELPLIIIP
ncbi:MAG: hypothetical protein AB8H12_20650 [Lewinella sp.]